ncbi:hypothetical protein UYO_0075 [Lachnospiraceae bacterium JC7]|nr:hypothetical protein UYO_0075 [Lachnospiraceae bacterium JC7]
MCGDESCTRTCKGCYEVCNKPDCPDYEMAMCIHVSGAPFVCNGCPSVTSQTCHFPKFSYDAKMAQQAYEDKLKESREGISISPEDMTELDNHNKKRYGLSNSAFKITSYIYSSLFT